MYKSTVTDSFKTLSVKEKLGVKDLRDAISLNAETTENPVFMTPVNWVSLHIVNDQAEEPEYDRYVFVDASGDKYFTGSQGLFETVCEIMQEMSENAPEEEYQVKIYQLPSRKRSGKNYLTASIVI